MGQATLIGFSAVALWALLALLTHASGSVPPLTIRSKLISHLSGRDERGNAQPANVLA